jgi:hypothetical protein
MGKGLVYLPEVEPTRMSGKYEKEKVDQKRK